MAPISQALEPPTIPARFKLSICLGHDNIRTTQGFYNHLTPEHAARTAALKIYTDNDSIRRGPRME
jgi:hypothetical protein